ncbi:hypothetical protein BGZ65_004923 [Modicella reniformis]|uniref:Uncharacterized protein n=1 Tax=Modicella reniformis TaxID=1440133 RepID=A0A9P6IN61_9FUNG|nr:hypothetical protein BGZ65_004923 [Modicella reniformis]
MGPVPFDSVRESHSRCGQPVCPYFKKNGWYLRLVDRIRGVFLLEFVGQFAIPTQTNEVASLLADLPTLIQSKIDIEAMVKSDVNALKRSWNFGDSPKTLKKRLS